VTGDGDPTEWGYLGKDEQIYHPPWGPIERRRPRWSFVSRRTPLRCRFFGHKPIGFRSYGGWPEAWFELRSHCDRCGTDTTLTVPSSIEIRREDL
jgi:hypothetical protein